eukprot:6190380-Pyramimonas_sp.AAC.1
MVHILPLEISCSSDPLIPVKGTLKGARELSNTHTRTHEEYPPRTDLDLIRSHPPPDPPTHPPPPISLSSRVSCGDESGLDLGGVEGG